MDGTGSVSFINSSTVLDQSVVWSVFFFTVRDLVSLITRAGPRSRGAAGRLKVWLPLKSIFFNLLFGLGQTW